MGNQLPHNISTVYERKREKGDRIQSNPGPSHDNKYVSGAQTGVFIKNTWENY